MWHGFVREPWVSRLKYVLNLGQVCFCDGLGTISMWANYEYIFGDDLFICLLELNSSI
jgi:hypothetical protein